MTTPLIAPPEAQPSAAAPQGTVTETLSRPFRLGLVGLGAAVGLFVRLLAANNFGELNSQPVMLGAALTSALMGLGLLLIAAERDRFGPPLAGISIITGLAWGALNWISPPFATSVTVWSKPDQLVLAVLGVGNGLLLAGIVALAFVRRHPTLTVAATMVGSVFALASNTILLRDEWPAIVSLGIAFALILLAWDRSPRRELVFERPTEPPRVSRAALSFISVALCGTAIQLWTSRTNIPRSIPAVIVCAVLIIGAFASLIRVRREIERRGTTLSEWTSWAREIRTNDFRAEMQNFESDGSPTISFDNRPVVGADGQAPRTLSFPGLAVAEPEVAEPKVAVAEVAVPAAQLEEPTPASSGTSPGAPTLSGLVADSTPPDAEVAAPDVHLVADVAPSPPVDEPVGVPELMIPTADSPAEPTALPHAASASPSPTPDGVFSTILADDSSAPASGVQIADLDALAIWLRSPAAAARNSPLLVAIEALSLDEFESLPPTDAAMATSEIGSFLADTMPDADMVSWIDGPYFIVAHASKPDTELLDLNKNVLKSLKATNGTLAFLRPALDADLDDIVNECVMGLLHARRAKEHAAGR